MISGCGCTIFHLSLKNCCIYTVKNHLQVQIDEDDARNCFYLFNIERKFNGYDQFTLDDDKNIDLGFPS